MLIHPTRRFILTIFNTVLKNIIPNTNNYFFLFLFQAVVQEHVSKANLMFENSPAYLVPDTNCFIDQLSGLQAIVMSNDFTLVVPIVGKK